MKNQVIGWRMPLISSTKNHTRITIKEKVIIIQEFDANLLPSRQTQGTHSKTKKDARTKHNNIMPWAAHGNQWCQQHQQCHYQYEQNKNGMK